MTRLKRSGFLFAPKYVLADRGYDAKSNYKAVSDRGATPIILIKDVLKNRKQKQERLYEGIYNYEGVPTCMGMELMEFVRTDPKSGHLYRCPDGGCHLKGRKGVVYCQDTFWVNRPDDPRRFGPIRRDSKEWKGLYAKRQSIERVFKSLKQSRRLNAHCHRGLKRIELHAVMSVLTYQATVMAHLLAGETDMMRWMVRKVA